MKRALIAAGASAGAAGLAFAGLKRAMRPLPEVPLPGVIAEVDGERIHYVDRGAGEAVVLIHGFAASLFTWRHTIPALESAHRVVAIDLPGFGFSDRSLSLDYSHEAHARRIARLMDELGIERATVVGHSMGGGIAQRLAVTYPGRVDRLLLLAAIDASQESPWHDGHRLNPALLPIIEQMARFPAIIRFASRQIVRDVAADPDYATPEIIDGYVRPILVKGTARAVAKMVEDTRRDPPVDLSSIARPTLVISGGHDRAVPSAIGERLATAIPGARHVVIPGVGHLCAEERPESFIEELRGFMASGDRSLPGMPAQSAG